MVGDAVEARRPLTRGRSNSHVDADRKLTHRGCGAYVEGSHRSFAAICEFSADCTSNLWRRRSFRRVRPARVRPGRGLGAGDQPAAISQPASTSLVHRSAKRLHIFLRAKAIRPW